LAIQPGQALAPIPAAHSADPKNKEEKRFARADKNENGRITLAELVEPRRKPFAKLDVNGDGQVELRGVRGEEDRQVRGRRQRQELDTYAHGIRNNRAEA
jgi:hypothetical protein